MRLFDRSELKKLYKPKEKSSGEDNGQLTIIGGSRLFHGAPLFGLKVASRIVDMVFFATPDQSVGRVAEKIKSKLFSFIWIPWQDTEAYIKKSDAVLIGPGFMRFGSESTKEADRGNNNHEEGIMTKLITETLLGKFPKKKWVIDGGSLQVMNSELIPENSIITPNSKEFELLFRDEVKENLKGLHNFSSSEKELVASQVSKKHKCTVVLKGPETVVASPDETVIINGGNAGMTKGGTGDVLAGLTAALLSKNDPFLAACSASYVCKFAADELYKNVGVNYNSDDLADKVPEALHNLTI